MQQLRRVGQWLLETSFPQGNRCMACRASMPRGREHSLCEACEAELQACAAAGQRDAAEVSEFAWAAAPYRYEGLAQKLVRSLKFANTRLAAVPLGQAMAALTEPARWDLIVPVPMFRKRQGRRGYNQAELLCAQTARLCGLPMASAALRRARGGHPQVGMSREERLSNLQGAFEADPALVSGKRVLLVDDVCTTGATAAACAEALYRAGAAELGLLTACRA